MTKPPPESFFCLFVCLFFFCLVLFLVFLLFFKPRLPFSFWEVGVGGGGGGGGQKN